MARRMFSPQIVGSDAFLDMPTSSRELYFQLGMYADDDGFVNPKRIIRMIGASEDDLKILVTKRFVLPFNDGIIVIKHWRINNLVRKDWYQETKYLEDKKTLFIKENGAYTDNSTQGKPIVTELLTTSLTQVRLGKDRLDNNNAPPKGDVIESLLNEKGQITHDYQYLGLEIYEKTGAPENKKAECIRIAKQYPLFVPKALSFCLDYPNKSLTWKMFLWKLNDLRKHDKINNTSSQSK